MSLTREERVFPLIDGAAVFDERGVFGPLVGADRHAFRTNDRGLWQNERAGDLQVSTIDTPLDVRSRGDAGTDHVLLGTAQALG